MNLLRQLLHCFKRFTSVLIWLFVPLKKGRVLCEAQGGLQYSCNPKYIAEYLLEYYSEDYEIIFTFVHPDEFKTVDSRIKKIRKASFKEFFYINTAEFIISNYRLNDYGWGWRKRKGQKYIMTWHGSMALKRVEFDAAEHLPASYLKKAEQDSQNIDLMLSDSIWCTKFAQKAFHYYGEILERGLPRNDVFFFREKMSIIRKKVFNYYGIKENKMLVLYAPTFRDDHSMEHYILDWDEIHQSFERRFKSQCVLLVRIHPGIKHMVNTLGFVNNKNVIDVTDYQDMQELICATDILVTDYSSTMFEAAITMKPCFLFVQDAKTYSRGVYFSFEELPFPYAYDKHTFIQIIESFNLEKYKKDVEYMFSETFHYVQDGNASKCLVSWMKAHSI